MSAGGGLVKPEKRLEESIKQAWIAFDSERADNRARERLAAAIDKLETARDQIETERARREADDGTVA